MGRQKTRDVVVTVRNAGGSELVIEGARSACECFKAAFDRKRIAPGQSAAMTVNIRTLKRRDETKDKWLKRSAARMRLSWLSAVSLSVHELLVLRSEAPLRRVVHELHENGCPFQL